MAFIPTVQTVLVEFISQLDDQVVENTLYFQNSATVTPTNMEALAAAAATWYQSSYLPGVSADLSFNSVRVTDQNAADAPVVVYTTGLPDVGGNASPAMPNNVSLALTFYTAARGRTSRGRNFIVGLCEDQVVKSRAIEAVLDYFLAGYAELIGAGALLAGWQWCVVSHRVNNAPRVTGLARPVTSIGFKDDIIDSMRRRLPGRGD